MASSPLNRGNFTVWLRLTVVAIGVSATGCASERPTSRPFVFNRDKPYASRLGQDLRAAPPGITIPPPSIGVDLVHAGRRLNNFTLQDSEIRNVRSTAQEHSSEDSDR